MTTRIAVLLTCHNRVDRTVNCLRSLTAGEVGPDVTLETVVVDAGSSDGTSETVRREFPDVTVLRRGPELFWNGGMRVALGHAYAGDPDLYLWLNDDVELDADALRRLLATYEGLRSSRAAPCVVVGSTRDPATGELTYGGVVRPDPLRRTRYERVEPGEQPVPAETMNGNCVLIPRDIVRRIGSLAAVYTHGMGDFDYGHRAVRAGGEVWVAPGTIGTCARNAAPERAATLEEHRRRATDPKAGLPPAEWSTFTRRWAGPLWPIYAASPYLHRFVRWVADR
jgi:GT2 family glycosyltransferase